MGVGVCKIENTVHFILRNLSLDKKSAATVNTGSKLNSRLCGRGLWCVLNTQGTRISMADRATNRFAATEKCPPHHEKSTQRSAFLAFMIVGYGCSRFILL